MHTPPMNAIESNWEARLANLWKRLDKYGEDEFVEAMRQLTAELPEHHPVGLFELAAASSNQ